VGCVISKISSTVLNFSNNLQIPVNQLPSSLKDDIEVWTASLCAVFSCYLLLTDVKFPYKVPHLFRSATEVNTQLFIEDDGCCTSLHAQNADILLCVFSGTKRVILFPGTKYMELYPSKDNPEQILVWFSLSRINEC
jgi:hypothetical protein